MKTALAPDALTRLELADVSFAASMRASAYAKAMHYTENEARLAALAAPEKQFSMLALKVQAVLTREYDDYLTAADLTAGNLADAVEAVKVLHREKGRTLDRKTFLRLDALLDKLKRLHADLQPASWEAAR